MHIYLTARHPLVMNEGLREYVEKRIIQPVREHGAQRYVTRVEVQLEKETERDAQVACHILASLKGGQDINVREIASDARAAIDLAQDRLLPLLTEHRDRQLTLARHPKKYSVAHFLRALGLRKRPA